MESSLTPREIQTRMRAGATLAEVAEAAGVPESQILAFAAPVIAERKHVAGAALQNPLRRAGQGSSQRSLQKLVEAGLAGKGVDYNQLDWDAWRIQDKIWMVQATWGEDNQAQFSYDIKARFSIATNELAKEIVDDYPPQPPVEINPDNEPTIELTQQHYQTGKLWNQPTTQPTAPKNTTAATAGYPAPVANQNSGVVQQTPAVDVAEDFGTDFTAEPFEGVELQENEDGTYELVPTDQSQIDILYQMLESISEDSVRIYQGLEASTGGEGEIEIPHQTNPSTTEVAKPAVESNSQPTPKAAESVQNPLASQADAGMQDALVEVSESESKRSVKKRSKRRASVPSWDEIMFGGPKPKDS